MNVCACPIINALVATASVVALVALWMLHFIKRHGA